MKPTFFARFALPILAVVFFVFPFVGRGARTAVEHMKNDVKDWLPAAYDETGELDWFRQHFLGEQFVMVSWPGCTGDETDHRYRMFVEKLRAPMPPSKARALAEAQSLRMLQAEDGEEASSATELQEDAEGPTDASDADVAAESLLAGADPASNAGRTRAAETFLGAEPTICDELGLYVAPSEHFDWGGMREKWLRGQGAQWYFITPNGRLYRWLGDQSIAGYMLRTFARSWSKTPDSEFIHDFGTVDGPWYYENPRRMRASLFKTLTSGPDVLATLTDPETGVLKNDPEEAKRRLSGSLFGPDGKQTCIVLTLSDAAKRDLHLLVGRGVLGKPYGVLHAHAAECGIKPEDFHLGGPPVDNVAIDEEGSVTLVRLIGLSLLFGVTLSYLCFRSFTASMMVFFVGGASAAASVAAVYYLGSSVDAIMMSMPSLIYVLGLSGSVHLINYYNQAVEEHGLHGACERAVAHAWKPALLCNVTTAIGLVSLYTSDIVPIRKFGMFSALGVMIMLAVTFTYLPAALYMWPYLPKKSPERRQNRRGVAEEQPSWLERSLSGFWEWFGKKIVDNHAVVAIACLLFIGVVGFGVTRVQTSVNLMKMFSRDAKVIRDYEWLEKNIGRLVPMEIVVKFGREGVRPGEAAARDPQLAPFQWSFYDRLALIDSLGREIEREFGPEGQDVSGRVMSTASFAPPIANPDGDALNLMKFGAGGRLEAYRQEFLKTDFLREDNKTGDELWRLSVRLAATRGLDRGEASLDHGQFTTDLADVVEPVLEAARQREQILRTIVAARGESSYGAARVVLVGERPLDEAIPSPGDEAAPATTGPKTPGSVDRHEIFLRALRQSLAVLKPKLSRHRIGDGPLAAAKLADAECVLLVGDVELPSGIDRSRVLDLRQVSQRGSGKRTSAMVGLEGATTRFGAVYTGVVPIVYKAQRALLASLIESSLWSFLTITPLMMFVARGVFAGGVAMLPNALPILVVFGAMGWMGVEVDVGSMMSASIALGVAVDDTIHYLTWFREELDRVKDRKLAIMEAYRRCATPTLQAAVISGLGLSIFAFSTFTPTQRFGMLMLTILFAGVAAELIFFPALLAGPLGAAFKPRDLPPTDSTAPAEASASADSDDDRETRVDAAEPERKLIRPHLVRKERGRRTASDL